MSVQAPVMGVMGVSGVSGVALANPVTVANPVKMDAVAACGGGIEGGAIVSSAHTSSGVVLLDYADVVPGSDARLLEHDLSHMRALIDSAIDSVQSFYVKNPTFIGHQGKECTMHRRVCFLADPQDTHGYFYSKQLMQTTPITPECVALMEAVRTDFGVVCNGMLFNEYAPDSYISDHRDAKDNAHKVHDVFAINHGVSRVLRIKEYDCVTKSGCTKRNGRWWDFATREYTGLHMCGSDFQELLTHGIPKMAATPEGLRTSITFRLHDKEREGKQYNSFIKGKRKREHASALVSDTQD